MTPKLILTKTIRTGLRHFGCAGATFQGRRMLFLTGEQGGAGGRPALLALDEEGTVAWRDEFPEEAGRAAMGAEPHVVDLGGGALAVAHFVAHRESGADGVFRVLSPLDGVEIWRAGSGTIYGGNRDVTAADLDGDGEQELLVGYADRLVCYRARDGAVKWSRTDRMGICWGRSAVGDINGDGRPETVLGSEYANPDRTSSVFALRGDGSLLWRRDLGGGDVVVGDVNGDGALEAVCVANGRDGGLVSPAIRCVSLPTGELLWEIPLERHWLTGWPTLFDADGDGVPEAILPHGNPSGYGRQGGEGAWGEVLVARGDGTLLQRLDFSDWVLAPLAWDWGGGGAAELLVPCGDGNVYVYRAA